jgi:hypothetical protein
MARGKHRQPYKLFNTPLRWKIRRIKNRWWWFIKPQLKRNIIAFISKLKP